MSQLYAHIILTASITLLLCQCQTPPKKEAIHKPPPQSLIITIKKNIDNNNIEPAIAKIKQALKLFPDHFFLINNLGVLLCQQGKTTEGKQWLKKAQQYDYRYAYFIQSNLEQCRIKSVKIRNQKKLKQN